MRCLRLSKKLEEDRWGKDYYGIYGLIPGDKSSDIRNSNNYKPGEMRIGDPAVNDKASPTNAFAKMSYDDPTWQKNGSGLTNQDMEYAEYRELSKSKSPSPNGRSPDDKAVPYNEYSPSNRDRA